MRSELESASFKYAEMENKNLANQVNETINFSEVTIFLCDVVFPMYEFLNFPYARDFRKTRKSHCTVSAIISYVGQYASYLLATPEQFQFVLIVGNRYRTIGRFHMSR